MGLFDGLGENDSPHRKAAVMRRQKELLEEQIADNQRRKISARGVERERDRNEQAASMQPESRQPPPLQQQQQQQSWQQQQHQQQSWQQQQHQQQQQQQGWQQGLQQPLPNWQQALWQQPASKQFQLNQPFLQQIQRPVPAPQHLIQLPNLLMQPLQQQLPQLPPLGSIKPKWNSFDAPQPNQQPNQPYFGGGGGGGAQPSLQHNLQPSQTFQNMPPSKGKANPAKPNEIDIDGEWQDWKARRGDNKHAEPFPSSEGSAHKAKQKKNVIDLDGEWGDWMEKRQQHHPSQEAGWKVSTFQAKLARKKGASVADEENSDNAHEAPSMPAFTQPSPPPQVKDATSLWSPPQLQPPMPQAASLWSPPQLQPPMPKPMYAAAPVPPSQYLPGQNIRALAASSLAEELRKVKRSCGEERGQLHLEAESLKKMASRLRTEQASLPSASPRLQVLSHRAVPLAHAALKPRSPPRLVFAEAPSKDLFNRLDANHDGMISRAEIAEALASNKLFSPNPHYQPSSFAWPSPPEAFWNIPPTSPGGKGDGNLDIGDDAASMLLTVTGYGALPEASDFLPFEEEKVAADGNVSTSPNLQPPAEQQPSNTGHGSDCSQPVPLESTLLSPKLPKQAYAGSTETSDFFNSLQYSDSDGGLTQDSSPDQRQRLQENADPASGGQAGFNKVINLGAALRGAQADGKGSSSGTPSGQSPLLTQDFLMSALIGEDGGSAPSRPPLAPGKGISKSLGVKLAEGKINPSDGDQSPTNGPHTHEDDGLVRRRSDYDPPLVSDLDEAENNGSQTRRHQESVYLLPQVTEGSLECPEDM
ncbi:unnamed protein product [Polarella glacialis]|uniref:EF-hand domain-containing protein n=1 Tax=Polarella glacialis TaxID=89957 RepID=A0A813KNK3_POLGL|nr:unnamed protein product [Polarella glacialis]